MIIKNLFTMVIAFMLILLYGCSNPASNGNDEDKKNDSNKIEELNYDNNVTCFSLHLGTPSDSKPDLTVEGVRSPQHHLNSPSGAWSFNYRVVNMGQDKSSSPCKVKIYLSYDNIYSASDQFITEQTVGTLNVGDYDLKSATVSIPSGYSSGEYLYVIIVVDANDEVNELNEDNNYNYFCLHIGTPSESKPDLVIENLYSQQHHVNPGEGWNINYRVQNMGEGEAEKSSNVKIYLSKDRYISSDDYLIGEDQAGSILKGKYDNLNTKIKIPEGISTGYYYVLVKANAE